MPVEVSQGYHFLPKPKAAAKEQKTRLEQYAAKRAARQEAVDQPIPQADSVRYNFLHDLECLLWLVLWAITYRIGYSKPVSEVFVPFVNTFVTHARSRWLNEPHLFANALKDIPSSVDNVKQSLDDARDFISSRYEDMCSHEMRQDIAQHSSHYVVMRDLVFETIPDNAPPLVKIDPKVIYTLLQGTTGAESVGTSSKRAREGS